MHYHFRVEILICQNLGKIIVHFFFYTGFPGRCDRPPFSIEIGTGRKEGNWKGVRGKNFTSKRGRGGRSDVRRRVSALPIQEARMGQIRQTFSVAKYAKMYFKKTVYTIKIFFSRTLCQKHIFCVPSIQSTLPCKTK